MQEQGSMNQETQLLSLQIIMNIIFKIYFAAVLYLKN